MLYRDKVEFAVGHGVSVHWELSAERVDRAIAVRTQVVPSYDVPVTEAPTEADLPGLAELILDMRQLADLDEKALAKTLEVLHRTSTRPGLADSRIESMPRRLGEHEPSAREALETCRRTAERLKAGHRHGAGRRRRRSRRFASPTARCGCSASAASTRSSGVGARTRSSTTVDVPKNRSWRPFQLAFVLLSIPSLADPTHPDRTDPAGAIADLLWFPTGGGKTEAYLGVAAFTMAHPPAAGPSRRARRRARADGAHALHAAPADAPAVPARVDADLRLRGDPPRGDGQGRQALGRRAVPHRPVGRPASDAEHDRADAARRRSRTRAATSGAQLGSRHRPAQLEQLPVVRLARSSPGATSSSRRRRSTSGARYRSAATSTGPLPVHAERRRRTRACRSSSSTRRSTGCCRRC